MTEDKMKDFMQAVTRSEYICIVYPDVIKELPIMLKKVGRLEKENQELREKDKEKYDLLLNIWRDEKNIEHSTVKKIEEILPLLSPDEYEMKKLQEENAKLKRKYEEMTKEDMTDRKCEKKWCRGIYQETSLHDDWEGKLHCVKCGREVDRWREIDFRKILQERGLSPTDEKIAEHFENMRKLDD